MDSLSFVHELTKNTNYVHDVTMNDGEIYQLAQKSLIVICILKEWI